MWKQKFILLLFSIHMCAPSTLDVSYFTWILVLTKCKIEAFVKRGPYFYLFGNTSNHSKRWLRYERKYEKQMCSIHIVLPTFSFYPHFHNQQRNVPLKNAGMIFSSSSPMSLFSKPMPWFKKWEKERQKQIYIGLNKNVWFCQLEMKANVVLARTLNPIFV